MTAKTLLIDEIESLYKKRDYVMDCIEQELLNSIDNDDLLLHAITYRKITKDIRKLEKALEALK